MCIELIYKSKERNIAATFYEKLFIKIKMSTTVDFYLLS